MNVAICTSDSRYMLSFIEIHPHCTVISHSREGTMEFVEEVGLSALVDMIVCGDDQVEKLREHFFKIIFYF